MIEQFGKGRAVLPLRNLRRQMGEPILRRKGLHCW
jgi:hypothetical protein